MQRSPLFRFAVSLGPHVLVQCTTVTMDYVLTRFRENIGNGFLPLKDARHTSKITFLIARRSFVSNLRTLNPECLYVRLSSVRGLLARGTNARAHMRRMWRPHNNLIITTEKKTLQKTHTI